MHNAVLKHLFSPFLTHPEQNVTQERLLDQLCTPESPLEDYLCGRRVKSIVVGIYDGRDGAPTLMARPSSGITTGVEVARSEEGCLEGDCRIDTSKELANEYETVIEASNIA